MFECLLKFIERGDNNFLASEEETNTNQLIYETTRWVGEIESGARDGVSAKVSSLVPDTVVSFIITLLHHSFVRRLIDLV